MTKSKKLDAGMKNSNATSTLANETAELQLTIDPLLAQILHHATKLSALVYDKKEYLKKFNGYYECLEIQMNEISNLAGDIMMHVGEAIGMDIAEQGFDNAKLLNDLNK